MRCVLLPLPIRSYAWLEKSVHSKKYFSGSQHGNKASPCRLSCEQQARLNVLYVSIADLTMPAARTESIAILFCLLLVVQDELSVSSVSLSLTNLFMLLVE